MKMVKSTKVCECLPRLSSNICFAVMLQFLAMQITWWERSFPLFPNWTYATVYRLINHREWWGSIRKRFFIRKFLPIFFQFASPARVGIHHIHRVRPFPEFSFRILPCFEVFIPCVNYANMILCQQAVQVVKIPRFRPSCYAFQFVRSHG